MRELSPGTRIGTYRIVRLAGRGAVGMVYLAEDEASGRSVAVKTLNPVYAEEGVFRERFTREAQGAAAVNHPNIISILDAGEHERLPYLVMSFVDGPDLEQVLQDRKGRLEPGEAILVCSLIADALDTAGRHGLAHRDVKPANILVEGWDPERYGGPRRTPTAYLTDFGLIKSSAQATITRTGQFVGTLLYMSPEQIQSRAVPASDQYSLACVLWECLTGTLPFEPSGGSTLSVLSAHLSDPVPLISGRPGGPWSPELDRVFATALAKAPEDRWSSCRAFVDAATRALGLGASAPVPTPSPPLSATGRIPTSRSDAPASPLAGATPGGSTPQPAGPPPPLAGARPVGAQPSAGLPTGGTSAAPGSARPGTYVPPGLPPGMLPDHGEGAGSNRGLVVAGIVVALLVLAAVVLALVLSGG